MADPLMVQLWDGGDGLDDQLPKNFKIGDAFAVTGMLLVHTITQTPDQTPNGVVLVLHEPKLDAVPNYKPPSTT